MEVATNVGVGALDVTDDVVVGGGGGGSAVTHGADGNVDAVVDEHNGRNPAPVD